MIIFLNKDTFAMPTTQDKPTKAWLCCLFSSFRGQSRRLTLIDERSISKLDISDQDQCRHLRSLVESMPDASLIDSVSRLSPSSCIKLCNACPTIARSLTPSKLVSSIRALQHQPLTSVMTGNARNAIGSSSIDTTKKCNVFTTAVCTLYKTMGDKDYAWLLDTLSQAEQLEQVADLLRVVRHLECPSNRVQMDTFVRAMHGHKSIFVQKEMLTLLSAKLTKGGNDGLFYAKGVSLVSIDSMKLFMDMLRNRLLIGQTLPLFTFLLKQKLSAHHDIHNSMDDEVIAEHDKEELRRMLQKNKDKLIQLVTNKEELKMILAGRTEQQSVKTLLELLK